MANTLNRLYSQMDPQGTGSVNRDQFDVSRAPAAAKTIKADDLFTKLDTDNKGVISREDFVAGMKQLIDQNRSQKGGASSSTTASAENRPAPSAQAASASSKPTGVNSPAQSGNTGRLLNLYA